MPERCRIYRVLITEVPYSELPTTVTNYQKSVKLCELLNKEIGKTFSGKFFSKYVH